MTPPKPVGTPASCRVKGIRRVLKVYGPVDPVEQAKRERDYKGSSKIRKPHSELKTSVKDAWTGLVTGSGPYCLNWNYPKSTPGSRLAKKVRTQVNKAKR